MAGSGPPRLLDELPADGRPWRLDYVGGVTTVTARKTPLVRLRFTPFLGRKRSRSALQANRSYDWAAGKTILASVANLPFFEMGSLWTDGMPEEYPDYEKLTLDVDVRLSSTTLYTANGKTPHKNPIIPKEYYKIAADVADGQVRFGGFALPLSSADATPTGRVIVGLRPEAFEDGAFADPLLPRMDVDVEVVEELGGVGLDGVPGAEVGVVEAREFVAVGRAGERGPVRERWAVGADASGDLADGGEVFVFADVQRTEALVVVDRPFFGAPCRR